MWYYEPTLPRNRAALFASEMQNGFSHLLPIHWWNTGKYKCRLWLLDVLISGRADDKHSSSHHSSSSRIPFSTSFWETYSVALHDFAPLIKTVKTRIVFSFCVGFIQHKCAEYKYKWVRLQTQAAVEVWKAHFNVGFLNVALLNV